MAYADEPLAEYRVRYQPDRKHLLDVAEPRLFETPFRSPQPPLWEPADGEWLKALRLPEYAPRWRRDGMAVQVPLFADQPPVASAPS